MGKYNPGYCSWCLKRIGMITGDGIRALYKCPSCKMNIKTCITPGCQNFARWDKVTSIDGRKEKPKKIHDSFCLEHRGEFPDFRYADAKLPEPSDYKKVYGKPRKKNLARASKITIGAVGVATVCGPLASVSAPAIGGAIGRTFMGLRGVAATNAGLATLGGGSLASGGFGVAGGTALITALGGIVGSGISASVCYSYLKDLEYDIVRKGTEDGEPGIITINGFLSQSEDETENWDRVKLRHYPSNKWYHISWESKCLKDLGRMCIGIGSGKVLQQTLLAAAMKATKQAGKKLAPGYTLLQLASVAKNPWHVALHKAYRTGAILADILKRCEGKRFVLIGHSLGARVIYFALGKLAESEHMIIDKVHLLGGAVGNSSEKWSVAKKAAVSINNYYSKNDMVLKYMYSAGTFFSSTPIGQNPIEDVEGIQNYDVSSFVNGHTDYISGDCEYLRI